MKRAPKIGAPLYVFFIIAYAVAESKKNLTAHERALSIIALVAIPIFLASLYVADKNSELGRPTTDKAVRRAVSFAIAIFVVLFLYGTISVITFIEIGDEDCTRDTFSFCSAGKDNFFLSVGLALIVQVVCWALMFCLCMVSRRSFVDDKDVPIPPEERRQRSKDADSIVVQLSENEI